MKQQRFDIGDLVQLKSGIRIGKGERRGPARIVGYTSDVEGGIILSTRLGGFRCWNVVALEVALPKRRKG